MDFAEWIAQLRAKHGTMQAIADGTDPSPTLADGLQVQRVLAAVETSSDTRTWQAIERTPTS